MSNEMLAHKLQLKSDSFITQAARLLIFRTPSTTLTPLHQMLVDLVASHGCDAPLNELQAHCPHYVLNLFLTGQMNNYPVTPDFIRLRYENYCLNMASGFSAILKKHHDGMTNPVPDCFQHAYLADFDRLIAYLMETNAACAERLFAFAKARIFFENEAFDYQKQQDFINEIYLIFEKLAESETQHENLKLLKKYIHHLAQYLGFASRIGNSAKFPQNYLNDVPHATWQYVLLPEEHSAVKQTISELQQSDRLIKDGIHTVSKATSYLIGTSEGLAGASGIFPMLSGGWQFFASLVGVAGAYCNVYLFQKDIIDTLKEFFTFKTIPDPLAGSGGQKRVRRLFVDENNLVISPFKKALAILLGSCAIATGMANACLTYNIWAAFLAGSVGVFGLSWLVVPVACLFATVRLLGLTSILFIGILNIVKNPSKISQYFQKHFSAKAPEEGNLHYAARLALHGTKLLVVLGINAVVTVFNVGLMFKNARVILGDVAGLFSSIMDAGVRLGFGIRGNLGPIDTVIEAKTNKTTTALTPLQKEARSIFRKKLALGVAAAVLNGLGQAALLMSAALAAASVFGWPLLAVPAVVWTAGACKFAYSTLPNIRARWLALKSELIVPVTISPEDGDDPPVLQGVDQGAIFQGLAVKPGSPADRAEDEVSKIPNQPQRDGENVYCSSAESSHSVDYFDLKSVRR